MSARAMQAVVIGGSAGAVEALLFLLPRLPRDYPLPVIVVVHLPPDKKSVMATLFGQKCQIKVREADDKETLEGGTVYIAPADYHLLVEKDGRLSLSTEPPVMFSRPAIDVLFETAADAYGPALVGVILTGANSDGALGLKAIEDAGGMALVQRPELAYASAMPQAALKACVAARALNLEDISKELQKVVAQ